MALERGQCPRLVVRHEAAVADHVGSENCGETTFHARFLLVRRLAVINEGIHAERNYPNVRLWLRVLKKSFEGLGLA